MTIQNIQIYKENKMISDKQIKQALEAAGVEFQYFTHARTNAQMCTTEGSRDFNELVKGIRSIIALAQEVKPLEFIPTDHTNIIKQADTVCGEYFTHDYFVEFRMALPGDTYYNRIYSTEEEAIEAANADYRKRVLSCLVSAD